MIVQIIDRVATFHHFQDEGEAFVAGVQTCVQKALDKGMSLPDHIIIEDSDRGGHAGSEPYIGLSQLLKLESEDAFKNILMHELAYLEQKTGIDEKFDEIEEAYLSGVSEPWMKSRLSDLLSNLDARGGLHLYYRMGQMWLNAPERKSGRVAARLRHIPGIPDEMLITLRVEAKQSKLPLSKYVRGILDRRPSEKVAADNI